MLFDPACEQSLTGAAQLFALQSERCATRRRLRNQHQRERFCEVEPRGRLVEINEARGTDALDVAAVRHQVEMRLQQVALRVAHLQLHGACDLLQLAADAACVQPIHQSRELHRYRRTADARTAGVTRHRSAHQRGGIEASMSIEILVLVHQQRIDEVLRHFFERRPESILLIARERQSQQPSLLVEDCRRRRDACRQRRARREANADHRRCRDDSNGKQRRCDSPPHGRDTSSLPAAERPTTPRSYIASP